MLRPLSTQKKWDAFFTGDPAIIQLPADATDEQRKERARKIEVARETSNWQDVTVHGQTPTTFTMRPLPSEVFGDLLARLINGDAPFRVFAMAFRVSLLDAKPLPDGVQVGFVDHATYGRIATTSFLDEANCGGELGAAIMVELGQLAFERAKGVSPKS